MIANNNHLLRADKETSLDLSEKLLSDFKNYLEKEIQNSDIVLVSDYKKGLLTKQTTPLIISLCKKYAKKVLVDPKERDFSKYSGADIVKPNLKEFELVSGQKFDTQSTDFRISIKKSALQVMQQYNISNLLITLSKDGMIFISNNPQDTPIHISAEAKDVFDVSGAGDTSLAVLGCSLASSASISEAMKLANLASGIVVGKLGTACVTPDELKKAVDKTNGITKLSQASKIITLEDAVEIAKKLKTERKIIGFTNGCFDVMHLGHIHSLAGTKNECDVMFVGVNSDFSVKALKGEKHPLQNEKTRAYVVASLEFVDYVVLFDEKTALNVVDKLKPDVIAREGFAIENWPEAQKVMSYGGRVVELPRIEDYSVNPILKKIDELNITKEDVLNV
jgi:D-beta-D-heptose 7-phosphate kinase/D-beta-D-heptose 1-phosphate adenosyltransferase